MKSVKIILLKVMVYRMAICTTCICLFISVYYRIKQNDIYNPVSITSGIWGIITFMANLRLYGMNSADDLTYFIILIGIIAFTLGTSWNLRSRMRLTIGTKPFLNDTTSYEINYNLLIAISVISFIVMIYPAIIATRKLFVAGYSLSYIRKNIELYNIQILNLMYNYIAFPFSMAVIPIYSVCFVFDKNRNKKLGILTFLIIAERVFIEGGRFLILYLICDVGIAYLVAKKVYGRNVSIGKRLLMIFGVLLSTLSVFYLSSLRGIESFGESLYVYLCGVVPHLNERINGIIQSGETTFGLASLNGFFEFLFAMTDNFGIGVPNFYLKAKALAYVENIISISSSGLKMNAFVGPFFYMFLDGRYLGVILGMFLYGNLSGHYYKNIFTNQINKRALTVYILIAQALLLSMVRIEFANMYYVMAFFYIFIIIRKPQQKENKD